MVKYLESGFKISLEDQKAWDEYLLETPREWLEKAVKGLINKASKTIIKQYIDLYKIKSPGNISIEIETLIPALVNMQEFKPMNKNLPERNSAVRKGPRIIEVLEGGLDILDWEDTALKSYYKSPETSIRDLLENKIYLRRKEFVKNYTSKFINDKSVVSIPKDDCDMIAFVCNRPGYLKRSEREITI